MNVIVALRKFANEPKKIFKKIENSLLNLMGDPVPPFAVKDYHENQLGYSLSLP